MGSVEEKCPAKGRGKRRMILAWTAAQQNRKKDVLLVELIRKHVIPDNSDKSVLHEAIKINYVQKSIKKKDKSKLYNQMFTLYKYRMQIRKFQIIRVA